MDLRIYSDLHLEFDEFDGVNKLAFDTIIPPLRDDFNTILILAGDIGVGMNHVPFVQYMCSRFKTVLYVPGNHEYYRQDMQQLHASWNDLAKQIKNLYFLTNTAVMLDDVLFYGGTMWTSFANDWFVKQHCVANISDFFVIANNNKRFSGNDAERLHSEFITGLTLAKHEQPHRKMVTISHMGCTERHIHPRYAGNKLNPYFCTDMERYFKGVDLWIHGHVHDHFDTTIGNTRVYCNPRGYPNEGHELKHIVISI